MNIDIPHPGSPNYEYTLNFRLKQILMEIDRKLTQTEGDVWNGSHPILGGNHLWVDSSGNWRVKASAPTSDTDGTILNNVTTNSFQTIAVSGQSNVVADSSTDTLTLAAGTNITLTTNATTDTVTIAAAGGGGITLLTKQATTSGTDKDFTIPSGAKRVTVMFEKVSSSDSSHWGIRLGDAGGVETTGYVTSSNFQSSAYKSTAQFLIASPGSGTTLSGQYILSLVDASTFTWVGNGFFGTEDWGYWIGASGSKSLSEELTTVRIFPGTGNWDAGNINVSWE